MSEQPVVALSWNIEKGVNLRQVLAWVAEQQPAVFFAQEVPLRQLDAIAGDLGMTAYPAAHRPGSDYGNAIFVAKDGPFAFAGEHTQDWAIWRAPANIELALKGPGGALSPRTIKAVSGHSCAWSSTVRQIEADWFHTLAQSGWLAVVFSDWNSYRTGEGGVPWQRYNDPAFYANRTYQHGDGRRSDDRPDREMRDAGYVEMARYAAEHLGQREAMRPTSGYRQRPGRPQDVPPYTIDRGYLTPELPPALTSFTVCDTPDLRKHADHLPQRAEFAHAALWEILNRPVTLYEPHRLPDTQDVP